MSKTFFISDTHFGHFGIIRHAKRPFASVEEMDAFMIANWNKVVGPNDLVYHLGDFCWAKHSGSVENLLRRLNGRKVLIIGNHDSHFTTASSEWHRVLHYTEINIGSGKAVLFHYPITEWNGFYRGHIHLNGHVHGKEIYRPPNSFDVGVEKMGYTPRTLDEIIALSAPKAAEEPS